MSSTVCVRNSATWCNLVEPWRGRAASDSMIMRELGELFPMKVLMTISCAIPHWA